MKKIGLLGVPMNLGQPKKGVDLGANAIRHAGLYNKLDNLKALYSDHGNVVIDHQGSDIIDPQVNLKNLDEIVEVSKDIAKHVSEIAKKEQFPLILGGDHSISIGTIAGVHEGYENLGVIWYDAHPDLNHADISPSGNIHGMSLAVNLGIGHQRLTSINGDHPKVKPENVVIIGARSIDPGEVDLIEELGIKVFTAYDVEEMGIHRVIEEALTVLNKTDGIHLSFDVDALDPLYTPGTGTPVEGGLTFRESHVALRLLHESKKITSAEFVEVNPLLDDQNQTAEKTVSLIGALLGERYLV